MVHGVITLPGSSKDKASPGAFLSLDCSDRIDICEHMIEAHVSFDFLPALPRLDNLIPIVIFNKLLRRLLHFVLVVRRRHANLQMFPKEIGIFPELAAIFASQPIRWLNPTLMIDYNFC